MHSSFVTPKKQIHGKLSAIAAVQVNSAMNLSIELAVLAVLVVMAVRTDAVECYLAFHYSVTRCLLRREFHTCEISANVYQGMAAHAKEVMVMAAVCVVARPALTQILHCGQLAQRNQLAQRVVDSRPRNFWHHRQHALVYLVSGGMAFVFG